MNQKESFGGKGTPLSLLHLTTQKNGRGIFPRRFLMNARNKEKRAFKTFGGR